MQFLEKKVDDYGHTIIMDELNKESKYNSSLTADTIRVVNLWMGTVQSLYDSVQECDNYDPEYDDDLDFATFVNPVDKAAAFWFGDYDRGGAGTSSADASGSLYAWAERAKEHFSFQVPGNAFDANAQFKENILLLQDVMSNCLTKGEGQVPGEEIQKAADMRRIVDHMVSIMTVPMVQNLIHHAVNVEMGVETTTGFPDANSIDYLILYGLVTIPPIRICDENSFNNLYNITVTHAKTERKSDLYSMLTAIYSRLTCLGMTCEAVGTHNALKNEAEVSPEDTVSQGSSWPTCVDPKNDMSDTRFGSMDNMLPFMKIDLDIRTIGTLEEMEAREAAYDIFHWGISHRKLAGDPLAGVGGHPGLAQVAHSVQDMAEVQYHEKNLVGKAYDEATSLADFPDKHTYQTIILRQESELQDATATQRRIISENSMVTIDMHNFAINSLYEAVDNCQGGLQLAEQQWNRAYASITGWAEADPHANGFLMFRVARYLCKESGICDPATEDSKINGQLSKLFNDGRALLTQKKCEEAEEKIPQVEKLLLAVLIDLTAYFTEALSTGLIDDSDLAEAYGAAWALWPLMRNSSVDGSDVIKSNLAVIKGTPLVDGKDVVLNALSSFAINKGIDCSLLGWLTCDDSASTDLGTGGATPTTISPVASAPKAATGTPTISPVIAAANLTASPVVAASPTTSPIITTPTDETLGLNSDDEEDDDTMGSQDIDFCASGIGGGVPDALMGYSNTIDDLLNGAYKPTSNVDHIVKLTEKLELIEGAATFPDGLSYYRQKDGGISLKCLSKGSEWNHIIDDNPLYVIYMYGLWLGDDGDNDGDGYSNKMFDDGDILFYGDTIVMDEMEKSSGFDPILSAETIRVMNMWMSAITELYRAATICRSGYVKRAPVGFNPVDFAAAFWYGTAGDPDSLDGGSMYVWAKKANNEFMNQVNSPNEQIIARFKDLQEFYSSCRNIADDQREKHGIQMKHMVDEMTKWMTVPLVQNFIHHLAIESGLDEDESDDERNRMVLYALSVLPFISICDEDTYDDLYTDLISNIDSYDSATFRTHLEKLYSRFECLEIRCDMVGDSVHSDGSWPNCVPPALTDGIPGYSMTSDVAREILKFDLDISTILSFIVMEANDAALEIYENGRNVKDFDWPGSYIALESIKQPTSNPISTEIYGHFNTAEYDFTKVTRNAITGEGEFLLASPLIRSSSASLAFATIDMHLSSIDDMQMALSLCDTGGWEDHWDSAVAAVVGFTEGQASVTDGDDGGSGINGFLFYQLSEELCHHLGNCDGGKSIVNTKLIAAFVNGQKKLKEKECAEARATQQDIEKYLQAILIDSLARQVMLAQYATSMGDRHCLNAHVAKNALLPLIRPTNSDWADAIAQEVVANATSCHVNDAIAVYKNLHEYAKVKGIDCDLLGSSICAAAVDDTIEIAPVEPLQNTEYTPNVDGAEGTYIIFNGAYEPMTDVEDLHGISSVVNAICDAGTEEAAKSLYLDDDSAGLTIQSMSIFSKWSLVNELQFNQYVYAIQDSVDKTDGHFVFDGKPATEYANTISSDALDTSTPLGCMAVKTLNIWMWTVHKLNDAIVGCRDAIQLNGPLDEAAALWEGGLLFDMAEELGPKFGHENIDGMTFVNKQIVDRLNQARDIISSTNNDCDYLDDHKLRIIVKETISYMTAVLIQNIIHSMFDDETSVDDKEKIVELMAFAVLPHISACGHESAYKTEYQKLVGDGFEASMIPDTLSLLQRHYNCLGLSCDDVGRHINASNEHPQCLDNLDIGGYTPDNSTKTNMIAKLDLDAVAIHQLMSMEKYEAAKKIYMEGHNYYDYDDEREYSFVSLHNMTQSHTIDFTTFEMYRIYDESLEGTYDVFSNTLLLDAFNKKGVFGKTSAKQRLFAVKVAIAYLVSYMSALEALYFSASVCGEEGKERATITAYDGAVALLVGSVEGRGLGGNIFEEGQMFYSIGKRICSHLRNCRGVDSEVNVELMRALSEGQRFIKQGNCAALNEEINAINSLLKVPLVQSLFYFSDPRIAENTDTDVGAYVATMAVFPILNDIDPSPAAEIMSAMDFRDSLSPTDGTKEDVVKNSLSIVFSEPKTSGMLDCELITNSNMEMCSPSKNAGEDTSTPGDGEGNGDSSTPSGGDSNTLGSGDSNTSSDADEKNNLDLPRPDVKEPMPISDGLYVATNYVGDRSAIAQDVQEIKDSLDSNDFDRAKDYYLKGENSKMYDDNGMFLNKRRSIHGFSTESKDKMKGDPTYNLFVYGLSDSRGEFLGRNTTVYADSFISDLLYTKSLAATDAMVAIPIWMQVAHSLHSAYDACKLSLLTDERTMDGRLLQNRDPSLLIDEAAAYWIGDNQATGSSSEGHLLYALTEKIGVQFEKIPAGAESTINSKIIDLFNQAKNHITISRGCSTSADSHLKLKGIVDELIPLMAVPLLRNLFYYLHENDPVRSKVYAVAVLPLFSACSPSTYLELKDMLIDHDVFEIQKDYIRSRIQSLYTCLELTCDLVEAPGTSLISNAAGCGEDSDTTSLAGYRFGSEKEIITRASQVDIDMKKIEIFIENGVKHFSDYQQDLFAAAYDLYRYGQRSNGIKGSLMSMARDTNRDIVPVFGAYRRYFNADENYADTMLTNAFLKKGVFGLASVAERKRFIVFSVKYMITHMSVLQKLYSSLQSCKEDNKKEATLNLDLAAGNFIGSMEGNDDGGSFDGELIHALSKRMCVHFRTCTSLNHARINERIISLFYAGLGEIETLSCGPLERTVKEIENAMVVPLIQGLLISARDNELYYKGLANSEFYPEGYALAQTILPFIDDADESSAKDIANVMVNSFPRREENAWSNGSAKVRTALQKALSKMKGVDCSQIGSLDGNGFCPGDKAPTYGASSAPFLYASFVLLAVPSMLCLFAFY